MNDYRAIEKHIRYYQMQRSVYLSEKIADLVFGLMRLVSGPVVRKGAKRPSGNAPVLTQG